MAIALASCHSQSLELAGGWPRAEFTTGFRTRWKIGARNEPGSGLPHGVQNDRAAVEVARIGFGELGGELREVTAVRDAAESSRARNIGRAGDDANRERELLVVWCTRLCVRAYRDGIITS